MEVDSIAKEVYGRGGQSFTKKWYQTEEGVNRIKNGGNIALQLL